MIDPKFLKPEKPTRIVVDVPDGLHITIKKIALNRNMTMRSYICRVLLNAVALEVKFDPSLEKESK